MRVAAQVGAARRGYSFVEVLCALALLSVLVGSVAPAAMIAARRQAALATWIEDLEAGARLCDRLGRELREARRVLQAAPGGGVARTGASSLLLERPDGTLVGLALERRRPDLPAWLVRTRLDAGGRLLGREPLGQLEALALRYDVRRAPSSGGGATSSVVGVAWDLTLPRRHEGAKAALLSSYALVAGGEGLR